MVHEKHERHEKDESQMRFGLLTYFNRHLKAGVKQIAL